MNRFFELAQKIIDGYEITFDEALSLIQTGDDKLFDLIFSANKIKEHFIGRSVDLCSIVNARSGNCGEDCSFCTQSSFNKTKIDRYPLMAKDLLIKRAREAYENGIKHFGIVISGKSPLPKDFSAILDSISEIKKGLTPEQTIDGSLGLLTKSQAKELKDAGMGIYNHNIECSRSFFPQMCSTHTYEDRVRTIINVGEAGLATCVGCIFGLGESDKQRVEAAFEIRGLDTTGSVPLNFLNQVEGTRTFGLPGFSPSEVLRIIATYRFIFPEKRLRMGGGREVNLRDLQPLMFIAGADATITGNYLTTTGKSMNDDLQMIKDLGLHVSE